MSASATEAEVLESVLILDEIGLGAKAKGILDRCHLREIVPLLTRQRRLLKKRQDQKAAAIDEEIAASFKRCLESLRVLYLTEAPAIEEEEELPQ